MKKLLGFAITIMLCLSGVAAFTSNILNPANVQSISDDVSVYFDDLMFNALHGVRTGDFDVLSMIPQFNHKQDYKSKATVVTGFEVSSFEITNDGFSN